MTVLIDSSSLLAFVRYYLPFDDSGNLKALFQEKFEGEDLIVIDKVLEECSYVGGGIVVKELPFLKDAKNKKKILNTDALLPTQKFFNLLENQFCNKDIKRSKDIDDAAFELEKNIYLGNADARLILFAFLNKERSPIIVTEETSSSNDSKLFRKIPDCCSHISGVECCPLPRFLRNHLAIDLGKTISVN